ncbi:MAG: HugZ family protein [Bauldia sp.]|nr:MAG: HugZ family protein [Bauldia sp.]
MAEKTKDVLRETDDQAIRLARTLIRTARHGAIAVIDPATGAPLASRVAVASDHDGAPIILVSALAAHTGGIAADPRCSLLLGDPGKGDAMAHARITIACVAEKIARDDPRHARIEWRFLSHNPKAKLYAGLGDFAFYRLEPQGASLNGGFGKAYALTRENLLTAGDRLDAIAAAERSAIEHMNEDHADAVANYAAVFGKAKGGEGWVMTGIDADGFDLAAGDKVLRIFFREPLTDAPDMHKTLVAMAIEARQAKATIGPD